MSLLHSRCICHVGCYGLKVNILYVVVRIKERLLLRWCCTYQSYISLKDCLQLKIMQKKKISHMKCKCEKCDKFL